MRVRVTATHHPAAILEYLHIADVFAPIQRRELLAERPQGQLDVGKRHRRQPQVMLFRVADDPARAGLCANVEER